MGGRSGVDKVETLPPPSRGAGRGPGRQHSSWICRYVLSELQRAEPNHRPLAPKELPHVGCKRGSNGAFITIDALLYKAPGTENPGVVSILHCSRSTKPETKLFRGSHAMFSRRHVSHSTTFPAHVRGSSCSLRVERPQRHTQSKDFHRRACGISADDTLFVVDRPAPLESGRFGRVKQVQVVAASRFSVSVCSFSGACHALFLGFWSRMWPRLLCLSGC